MNRGAGVAVSLECKKGASMLEAMAAMDSSWLLVISSDKRTNGIFATGIDYLLDNLLRSFVPTSNWSAFSISSFSRSEWHGLLFTM